MFCFSVNVPRARLLTSLQTALQYEKNGITVFILLKSLRSNCAILSIPTKLQRVAVQFIDPIRRLGIIACIFREDVEMTWLLVGIDREAHCILLKRARYHHLILRESNLVPRIESIGRTLNFTRYDVPHAVQTLRMLDLALPTCRCEYDEQTPRI